MKHAFSDADLLIAKTSLEKSTQHEVFVISQDTDIMVLLWHYVSDSSKSIILQTEQRRWDIQRLVEKTNYQHLVLLVHAFLGCDTTSRIFNIGKNKVFNNSTLCEIFSEETKVFYSIDSTAEEIARSGRKLFTALYCKGYQGTLNELRAKTFLTKVKNKNIVKPSGLPPTSDEATLHAYRVYHQVQAWLDVDKNPLTWGWCLKGNELFPVMSTLPHAPSFLLSYIRCGCKADGCNTNRCSCRKNGLPCTLACLHCNGCSCGNPQQVDDSPIEVVEDEDEES